MVAQHIRIAEAGTRKTRTATQQTQNMLCQVRAARLASARTTYIPKTQSTVLVPAGSPCFSQEFFLLLLETPSGRPTSSFLRASQQTIYGTVHTNCSAGTHSLRNKSWVVRIYLFRTPMHHHHMGVCYEISLG